MPTRSDLVRSIKESCLDRLIFFGAGSFRTAIHNFTKRACGLDEMRQLLSAARSVTLREHLIVRIFAFVDCGPANYLRCAFEALKETEKGAGRIGETKTESSNAYVSISEDLQK